MTARTQVHNLQVATSLYQFIEQQVLPAVGVKSDKFWKGFAGIVTDLAPKNAALLAERDRIQTAMDAWHTAHPGPVAPGAAMKAYRKFLSQIGYLVPEPKNVKATTANVDEELAKLAGPQLVVPILNARYALNAANARWGSLYDALYGTDAISEANGCEKGTGYNPKRGAKVIEYCRHVLDRCAPLKKGSHIDSVGYAIVGGQLQVRLNSGATVGLAKPKQLIGYQGDAAHPSSVLFEHNGIHLDLQINPQHPIGQTDPAGVCAGPACRKPQRLRAAVLATPTAELTAELVMACRLACAASVACLTTFCTLSMALWLAAIELLTRAITGSVPAGALLEAEST